MKHAGGRPKKYTREVVDAILASFLAYIEAEDIPIISEFAYKNNLYKQQMYDFGQEFPEFSAALKKCISKKEANLERGALSGEVNVSMAIFSLKQVGWSDKSETTHLGNAAFPIVIAKPRTRDDFYLPDA